MTSQSSEKYNLQYFLPGVLTGIDIGEDKHTKFHFAVRLVIAASKE